ncbi:MAG: hypothetical protein IBX68_01970 [Dehalococcoidia bacterium]|nr:hypothetical protein [Dehalococcoidia bacterium]
MDKRVSVGKRLSEDMVVKKGIDALFEVTPVYQHTSTGSEAKKFEKGTFYFNPDILARLDKIWLELMQQGIRCNKSEIVSILVDGGLQEHEHDPAESLLSRRLSGKRRRD